jgi:hypothetical protein
VLLVPYNQGAILISDRQSTRSDSTKEEWNKIYLLENLNAVIGFAGSSEGSRFICQKLREQTGGSQFTEMYVEGYRSLYQKALTPEERDIEALCILKTGNLLIEQYKFTRDIPERLDPNSVKGIGEGELVIRPQLNYNTNGTNLETAIFFGKVLIEYSSRVVSSVGPPAQFGFCLATVPLTGVVTFQVLPPEQVPIERLLYRF